MLYRWLPYGQHVLEFVYFCFHLSATPCCILIYAWLVSHVVVEAFSYFSHFFLKDTLCITHGH